MVIVPAMGQLIVEITIPPIQARSNCTEPRTSAVLLHLVVHARDLGGRGLELHERGLGPRALHGRGRLHARGPRSLERVPAVPGLLGQHQPRRPAPARALPIHLRLDDREPLEQVLREVPGAPAALGPVFAAAGTAFGLLDALGRARVALLWGDAVAGDVEGGVVLWGAQVGSGG